MILPMVCCKFNYSNRGELPVRWTLFDPDGNQMASGENVLCG